MAHEFGSAAPILRVGSVRASVAYFTETLGFSVDWHEGGIASVSRDRCTVFLCEWEQSQRGMWVWVGTRDVEALHEELRALGARIRQSPTNFPWALEMQIEDLDGNVLRIGSSPKKGAPFGSFLDAASIAWPTAESAG
jgi:hypothetical protein